jgi:biotin carboxylase
LSREAFLQRCERLAQEFSGASGAHVLSFLEGRVAEPVAAVLREVLARPLPPREAAVLVASALELRRRLDGEREYIENCLGSAPSREAFLAELSLVLEELYELPISYEALGHHEWPGGILDFLTSLLMRDMVARSMSPQSLEGKRLLVIGSGDVDHRAYILESLVQARCTLVLATDEVPVWENRYIKDHILCPFNDVEATVGRVRAYHQGNPFDGMICYTEPNIELASRLGERLGLKFLSPPVAASIRDKAAMRAVLTSHGLRSPKVATVDSPRLELPSGFRFPAVLKPRKGHSSINVVKVEDSADFERVWARLHKEDTKHESAWHVEDSYLLEEYLSGKEFSVESVVSEGRVTHVAITEKFKGSEPFFEEIGHCVPARLPPEVSEELLRECGAAFAALGIRNSVVHTELIVDLERRESATIVEVNSRLAGDKIPLLVKLATGFDMSQAAALAALGAAIPEQSSGHEAVAAICAFVPRSPGVVKKTPTLPEGVGEVLEFHFWTEVGKEVAPPPKQFFSRMGFVVVRGKDRAAIADSISKIVAAVSEQTGVELAVPGF